MATDQEIRDAGFKFIPQQKYLQNPFQLPVASEEPIINQGIVNTNAFNYGGGDSGGGALQVGDPMMNFDNYYDYTGNKYMMNQGRPNLDSYSDNAQKTFMGMPSYRQQELTGPDIGEYIGSNINIPLELTTAGRIQSGVENTGQGLKNLMGMLPTPSSFLNRIGIKNFNSLPEADQLFIKTNTGYRGPTVFGENTSMLNKDPFGMNVESLMGNYAQGVRDNFAQLQDTLTNKDRGAVTFNEATGMFEGEDEDLVARTNKQTNMIRKKFLFRRAQVAQQEKNQRDIDKRNAIEAKAAAAGGNRSAQDRQRQQDDARVARAYREDTGGSGGSYSTGESGVQKGGGYNDPFDPGGGEKDGGFIDGSNRRPFAYGGLASIL
jgi:hypothetical protein